MPIEINVETNTGRKYGIYSLPNTIIITPKMICKILHTSANSYQQLQYAPNSLLINFFICFQFC